MYIYHHYETPPNRDILTTRNFRKETVATF